jgi:Lon-like protease
VQVGTTRRKADAPLSGRPSPAETRTATTLVAGVAASALLALVTLAPVPYAVISPGPVRDVLGAAAGTPLIEIEGRETFPTDGSLALTTIRIRGGPGRTVSLLRVVRGWLDPAVAALPADEVFPTDATREDLDRQSTEEMVTSQEAATAAALAELDIPVPTTLTVAAFSEGSDAERVLEEGDVVVAVEGRDVTDLPQLREELQGTPAGDPVTVTVLRDGEPSDVEVTTLESPDGSTLLGVLVDPAYEFPFDVSIAIDNIGGPSAGMMFALGIVDVLTPGALTGGASVAGTGTIDSGGVVGRIGGIRQKLVGARRAEAEWFLAPRGNCDEVVGYVPDGLTVVPVATLGDAHDAVRAIADGAEPADLPVCPAGPGA